jgi:hypothetical protein
MDALEQELLIIHFVSHYTFCFSLYILFINVSRRMDDLEQELPALCRQADILIAAIGSPRYVQADWVKPVRPSAFCMSGPPSACQGRLLNFSAAV